MQTLGLDKDFETTPEPEAAADNRPKGFWDRRFGTGPTPRERKLDWWFGVIMPVVCVAFDPIIFTSRLEGSLLGRFRPFAYILSFVSIMAMIAWLLFGERLKALNAFLAGLFAFGGFISFAIGLLLVPISLVGLLALIGVLGFTPLFSAWVYIRNAVWAFRAARPFLERRVLISSFLLAALFSAVLPWTVNLHIKRELDRIQAGSAGEIRAATARLRYVKPLIDPDPLARQYYQGPEAERGSDRGLALAAAYEELSGKDIGTAKRLDLD